MTLSFRAETDANSNTFMTFRLGGIEQANLHSNGAFSAPVAIVDNLYDNSAVKYTTVLQCISKPVHGVGYFSAPINTPNVVPPLSIEIAPMSTSSIIVVQWMVTYELHWNAGVRIYKNGALATGGSSGTAETRMTYASSAYENDVSSTPNTWWVQWHETNTTLDPREYQFAVHSTDTGTAQTFYLNKTAGGTNPAAQDGYEVGTSHVMVWEIAT